MALGMNNFDSIVFLINFNSGYAMSIPDMANSFYVIDESKPGDGSDKVATITCHNNKCVEAGKAGCIGGDPPEVCDNPTFAINRYFSSQMGLTEARLILVFRQLVTLPQIDQTADKVFGRIIPAPNGDCKLVAYPGDANFPDYQMTINGLPSAIACGLTAAINVNGTAVPIQGDTNGQTPSTGSSGQQSTDGQGGTFVAPPPQSPFAPLSPNDYVCIYKYHILAQERQPFCLPPGAYGKQTGLGFEINDVDSLSLPPGGWSLATHWEEAPMPRTSYTKAMDETYTKGTDPVTDGQGSKAFHDNMQGIGNNKDGNANFTIAGPTDGPDPVCCLFAEPSFGGDVWCMGIGGGNTLPQWTNVPQSVSCHGGANVWLYAKEYGDAGGALIKGNVEDLKDEPYGNAQGSFSKNVKALWVLNGS